LDDVALPALTPRFIDSYDTGHDFPVGPRQIPHYAIVHVHFGTGWVQQSGPRRPLAAGDTFLVFPGVRYVFWLTNARAHSVLFDCPALAGLLYRIGLTPSSYLFGGCNAAVVDQAFERGLLAASKKPLGTSIELATAIWTILGELADACERKRDRKLSGLGAARRYLDEHALESVSVGQLAEKADLSRYHFMRAFKRQFGVAPLQYQIGMRMQLARQALLDGASVKQAATRAGYDDFCYFSKLFKQKTGMSPSNYCANTLVAPISKR
jgi:AraC-like DNA-binding protein